MPEEMGRFERAQKCLARVGVDRPETLRLLFRQTKPRHLEEFASNNVEQPDKIELVSRTNIVDCDHDSPSG
jgi:hypothetical protein